MDPSLDSEAMTALADLVEKVGPPRQRTQNARFRHTKRHRLRAYLQQAGRALARWSLEAAMGSGWRQVLFGGIGSAIICCAGPALADVIDGDWCADDGRHLSIAGPMIVTPGGTRMRGSYSRHSFAYTAPANEADSGQDVKMRLLNEMTVQIQFGPADRAPQIWHRCVPTS